MAVDSYKYLPRSFRPIYELTEYQADEPVWTPMERPVEDATIALLTSAGFYLKGEQEPFDLERERREPLWGDPSYRVIPRDVRQEQVDAAHLHLNTRDFHIDFNVALPIRVFEALEEQGAIGRLADEHYAFMGFQGASQQAWKEQYGPELGRRLQQAEVDALILAPA